MSTDLEKLREIYLADDVDSEDREDNLKRIAEWESDLRVNEDFGNWQSSDVTKSIIKQAKESYRECAARLMFERDLTDAERASLWAKQDAMLWLISLVARDAKAQIQQIQTEIKKALKVE